MKLYDQAEECELKVNDVVEVFGVFELDLEPEGVVPPGADNMQAMVAERTELEADLRLGLQHHQLVLFYQPVVNEVGRVVGVEALVRWQHPQRGVAPPSTPLYLRDWPLQLVPSRASGTSRA